MFRLKKFGWIEPAYKSILIIIYHRKFLVWLTFVPICDYENILTGKISQFMVHVCISYNQAYKKKRLCYSIHCKGYSKMHTPFILKRNFILSLSIAMHVYLLHIV